MRIALSILFTITLAACVRESGDVSQASADRNVSTTSAPSQNQSAGKDFPGNRPAGAAEGAQRVELIEYAVRIPQDLPAGKHSFKVVNSGKELHSFEIEGNGIEVRLPNDLPRGEEASVEVTLQPGTYEVYCPIPGHKEKGMTTQVTVR
jgi:uncharacterized cupredoxin-like copper-binding protein